MLVREILYKKSVELIFVTRSTYLGLRIAISIETSNAEAHADMI